MSIKLIILIILCAFAGVCFISAGIYFLSGKYLNKLNNATLEQTSQTFARNKLRAKTSGYIGLGIGALTMVFGIMLMMFPSIASALAFIYMLILMIACIILVVVFK